jgi:hypothetical protein
MTSPTPPLDPASPSPAKGTVAPARPDHADLGGAGFGSALPRAFGLAAVLVLGIGAAVGVPLFAAGALASADWPFFALGIAAALLAGMLALLLHGRFLDPRTTAPFAKDGQLLAGRLQSLLAAAFGAKLAVLIAGVMALRFAGVKFAGMATFAITFAGAALLCQLATATSLARAVQRRGHGSPARTASCSPEGNTP